MIIIFINYNNLDKDFNFIYSLFYYLKFKIQIIENNSNINEFIENNFDENNIFIFYEIFDIELFEFINIEYNKNIYYFINQKYDINDLIDKYDKIHFTLMSSNYNNLIHYKYEKIILNYQFDIDKIYQINDIENIIIYDKNCIDIHIQKFLINNRYICNFYDSDCEYKNKIIILDNILDESLINSLILKNNLILVRKNENLNFYFFYNLFIVYDNNLDICRLIYDIYQNKKKYLQNYNDYINYLKKKLLINNKKFYQYLENLEIIDNQFGFIILRSVQTSEQNNLWLNSFKNIRKYYRNKIVIIDDNSDDKYLLNEKKYPDLEIIKSNYKGRGEILPYYYLYIKKLFKKCLIIHDSVFLNKFIDFKIYDNDIYYLWHFDHKSNNLDGENKMIEYLDNDLIKQKYDEKKWFGCFGAQTIITYDFVESLQKKYDIFKLINYIDNREKRMNFERIFSVLSTLNKDSLYENKSIFGNIHDYIEWGYKFSNYIIDKDNGNLSNYSLVKTWHGR